MTQQLTLAPSPPLSATEMEEAAALLTSAGWQQYAWNRANQPMRYDSGDGARTLTLAPDEATLTVQPGDEGAYIAVLDAAMAETGDADEPGRLVVQIDDTETSAAVAEMIAAGDHFDAWAHDQADGTYALVARSAEYFIVQGVAVTVNRRCFTTALGVFARGEIAQEEMCLPPPEAYPPPGFTVGGRNPETGAMMFFRAASDQVVVPAEMRGFALVSNANRMELWRRTDRFGNNFFIAKRMYQTPKGSPRRG